MSFEDFKGLLVLTGTILLFVTITLTTMLYAINEIEYRFVTPKQYKAFVELTGSKVKYDQYFSLSDAQRATLMYENIKINAESVKP